MFHEINFSCCWTFRFRNIKNLFSFKRLTVEMHMSVAIFWVMLPDGA